jgi:ankyrin repeat protein
LEKEVTSDAEMRKWVNKKTNDEGFTALHFASFRGNIVLVRLLIEQHADISVRNKFGINMLHVAAQGD